MIAGRAGLTLSKVYFAPEAQHSDILVAVCYVDALSCVESWFDGDKLQPYASIINYGSLEDLEAVLLRKAISEINIEEYRDKKVVIKGCSTEKILESAYVEITRLLIPVASSILFGELCSTIPVYKQKK